MWLHILPFGQTDIRNDTHVVEDSSTTGLLQVISFGALGWLRSEA